MKTKLTLNILASDILENAYTNFETCPITRALARAGRPDLFESVGIYRRNNNRIGSTCILPEREYPELDRKIQGMYLTKNGVTTTGSGYYEPLPIEDFTIDIEFEE